MCGEVVAGVTNSGGVGWVWPVSPVHTQANDHSHIVRYSATKCFWTTVQIYAHNIRCCKSKDAFLKKTHLHPQDVLSQGWTVLLYLVLNAKNCVKYQWTVFDEAVSFSKVYLVVICLLLTYYCVVRLVIRSQDKVLNMFYVGGTTLSTKCIIKTFGVRGVSSKFVWAFQSQCRSMNLSSDTGKTRRYIIY